MKKYSSYANLKIGTSPKSHHIQFWPSKITSTPTTKKIGQIPLMLISKEPIGVPLTTKYSAGYLQRQKMFSSKKENKDVSNVKATWTNHTNNTFHQAKTLHSNKGNNSKTKKAEQKEKSIKKEKEKTVRIEKYLQFQAKDANSKPIRYEIQSPKGFANKIRDDKSKSKIVQKEKVGKPTPLINLSKHKEKKQKESDELKQYVTKYEPEQKSILLQCKSDTNLMKGFNIQEKKCLKGYYKQTLYSAFFSTKLTTFHQICKNHLVSSIEFLTYVKKNRQIIPNSFNRVSLPPTNRKTLIFDLDQTLIHCNQSLEIPHDVALQITFPNNSKIKAGINIRPYATQCLRQLSKYFEIIVFTASHQCYANVIIDYLDPNKAYISHRFFRQTCYRTDQGFYVKDLRVFTKDRDLSNMLLIDNAAYSYSFQPDNGVPIIPFYNNKADLELKEVTNYLKEFVETKDMKSKNSSYMKLGEYHQYSCPKQLINQLYY